MLEVLGSAGAPPKLRCNTFCAKIPGFDLLCRIGHRESLDSRAYFGLQGNRRLDIHRRILHGEFNTVVTQLIRHVIVREF